MADNGEIMSKQVRAILNDPARKHLLLDAYLLRKRREASKKEHDAKPRTDPWHT